MRSATDAVMRLVPLGSGPLPPWCDGYLPDVSTGDLFASRFWYDTILAHALASGTEAMLAVCGQEESLVVPLQRQAGRWRGLATPYSLEWRPWPAPGADAAQLYAAGRSLAGLLRGRAPTRLDALNPAAPGLNDMLEGLRAAGLTVGRYRHFGNWRQAITGTDWPAYLAARPPALRTTILRKLRRAERMLRFELVQAPGAALERAIAAYLAVRAGSWKPAEPFPHFDAALLRAAAMTGALRMGVLRRADGTPVAAQYWLLGGGVAALLKLAHDQAARADSPGTVLTALMIRHLIEVEHAAALDFGRGDDPYKQLWADERRQRIGVTLSDRWHPAGFLEWALHSAARGRALLPWRASP
jgi:hypothetical protein